MPAGDTFSVLIRYALSKTASCVWLIGPLSRKFAHSPDVSTTRAAQMSAQVMAFCLPKISGNGASNLGPSLGSSRSARRPLFADVRAVLDRGGAGLHSALHGLSLEVASARDGLPFDRLFANQLIRGQQTAIIFRHLGFSLISRWQA